MDLNAWFETLSSVPTVWAALAVAFGAGVEYVVPPMPGDSIVFAGALLAVAGGASPLWMGVAATLGAVGGTALAFAMGRWLRSTGRYARMKPRRRAAIDAVLERFEVHGPMWLIVNRFLPGVRGLVFVAAGVARIDLRRVLGYGAIGAVTWNTGLVGVAAWAGGTVERADDLLGVIVAAGGAAAAIVIVGIVRTALAGARAAGDADDASGDESGGAGSDDDASSPIDH